MYLYGLLLETVRVVLIGMILAGGYFLYIGGDFMEFVEQHILSGIFPILIVVIYIIALLIRFKIIKDQRELLKYEREQRILNEAGGRELSVEEKEIERAMKEKRQEIEKETLEESLRQLDNEIAVKKREEDNQKLLEGQKQIEHTSLEEEDEKLNHVEEPDINDEPPIQEEMESRGEIPDYEEEQSPSFDEVNEEDEEDEEEPEIDEDELIRKRREVFINKMKEAAKQRQNLEERGELDAKPYDPFRDKQQ